MQDSELKTGQAAAKALNKLNYQPPTPEQTAVALVGSRKWPEVIKLGEADVDPLLIAAMSDRYGIRVVIGKIGIPALHPLAMALQDSDYEVRDCAADALGQIQNASTVPVLLGFLKTCRVNPGYRFHGPTALQSLHRLGTVAVSHHSFTVGFTVYGAGTEFVSVHCLQDNLLQNSESFGRWRRTDCHSSRHPILSRRG